MNFWTNRSKRAIRMIGLARPNYDDVSPHFDLLACQERNA